MSDEQYPDPSSEAFQCIAQAALPLATLADVAARLEAARRDEQHVRNRRRLAELHRQRSAERAAAAAVYGPALNARWLAAAGLADLGAAWRAGHAHAEGDPRAADAAARVEMRLRHLHPPAMRHYDRRRAEGLTPAAAMAEAARIVAFVDPTAHPGAPGRPRPALHATVDPDIAAGHAAAAAYTPGLNPRWLRTATILDLGQVWQAAHRHAADDTRAAAAADHVEGQLRRLHPPAMRRYDGLRAAGHTPSAAMAEAAAYFAGIDPAARRGQPPPAHRRLPGTDETNAAGAQLAIAILRPRPTPDTPANTPPHAAAAVATSDATAAAENAARPEPHALTVPAGCAATAAAALRAQMFPQSPAAELGAAQRRRPPAAAQPTRSPAPAATPPTASRPQR